MVKICVVCGKEFETPFSAQITCGKECAHKRHRQLEAKRCRLKSPRQEKICPACGETFLARSIKQIFCSKKCKDSHFCQPHFEKGRILEKRRGVTPNMEIFFTALAKVITDKGGEI